MIEFLSLRVQLKDLEEGQAVFTSASETTPFTLRYRPEFSDVFASGVGSQFDIEALVERDDLGNITQGEVETLWVIDTSQDAVASWAAWFEAHWGSEDADEEAYADSSD